MSASKDWEFDPSKLSPAHVRLLNALVARYPNGLSELVVTVRDKPRRQFEDLDYDYLTRATHWKYNTLKNLLHDCHEFFHVRSTAAIINLWRKK